MKWYFVFNIVWQTTFQNGPPVQMHFDDVRVLMYSAELCEQAVTDNPRLYGHCEGNNDAPPISPGIILK